MDGGGAGPRRSPRRHPSAARRSKPRGSFASATASSLARGCPSDAAPPARPSSRNGPTKRPPVRPGSAGSSSASGSHNGGSGSGEKENALNRSGAADGSASAPGTPPKCESTSSGEPKALLSPTPYWKVLAERGDKTSPRQTRSAAKRAHEDGLCQLNELDESESSDDEERFDPSTMLRFEPPDQQLREQRALDERRRREAEERKERIRKEKVRKAREPNLESGSLAGRRAAKRAKRSNYKSDEPVHAALSEEQLAALAGPSREEIAEILAAQLAENRSERIEDLIAQRAAAEADASHYKLRYEELRAKHDALEGQVHSSRGSESELQLRCVEQKGVIDGYERRMASLEAEKARLEERRVAETGELAREKRALEEKLALTVDQMKEEHKEEVERLTAEAAAAKELADQNQQEAAALRSQVQRKEAKLDELLKANDARDAWDKEHGTREELLGRVEALERIESDLTSRLERANEDKGSTGGMVASLQADAAGRLAMIAEKDGAIAELEAKLATATEELEGVRRRMEGMQSPRSREAAERGFADEIGELEGKLATVESEKAELQSQLVEKEGEKMALMGELDQLRGQIEDWGSRVDESHVAAEEADAAAADLKAENERLKGQLATATDKYKESEQLLEEMAGESEELLSKLEATETGLKRQLEEAASDAGRKEAEMEAKVSAVEEAKEALGEELVQARADISNLQANVSRLEGELANSQQATGSLQSEKEASDKKLTELSGQLGTLTTHLEAAQSTIASLEAKMRAKDEYCEQFESIERKLLQEKHVLNEIRRDLHNRVIQLSGNIRVFVRVRPLIESERQMAVQGQQSQPTVVNRRHTMGRPSSANGRPSSRGSMGPGNRPSSRGSLASASRSTLSLAQGEEASDECPFFFPALADRKTDSAASSPNYTSFNDLTKQTIELTEPYKDRGGLNPRRKKWKYGFDRVFSQGDGQEDVWAGAEPLVQSCVDGFHVCMFAYGQTGSGKTHTMIGDAQNRGLIPRAVGKLFAAKKEIEQSRAGATVDIRVELLEIYNEEVRDLLDDNAGPDGQLIKLKLSSNEAVGNVTVNARDEQEVAGILKLAQERRCVKATKSNAESSRSHLLFTIHFDVSSTANDGPANRSGCLHIIDLAGSERLDKSGSHGALLTEAKHINTSLSALALVIEKLQAKKSSSEHIPFRDSKLTYLLRNSLGGDSKTLAIVCCSPHQSHFNESLNSIRFAAKASKVELKEGNKVDV